MAGHLPRDTKVVVARFAFFEQCADGVTPTALKIDRLGASLLAQRRFRPPRALHRLADAGTPLPLQFGVNRGHVFVAEVGTPWRAAYSAMGDTTNTAARKTGSRVPVRKQ